MPFLMAKTFKFVSRFNKSSKNGLENLKKAEVTCCCA